jgi:putative peptidoglycan lipid II flippase
LRFAILRVALTTGLGYVFAFPLPRLMGLEVRWGVAGLTASAGIAGWVEFLLLRRALNRRIGATGIETSFTGKLWGSALIAAGAAWAVKLAIGYHNAWVMAGALLPPYGIVYFGMTYLLRVEEIAQTLGRVTRMISSR